METTSYGPFEMCPICKCKFFPTIPITHADYHALRNYQAKQAGKLLMKHEFLEYNGEWHHEEFHEGIDRTAEHGTFRHKGN